MEAKFSTASLDRYNKFASPGTSHKFHNHMSFMTNTPAPEAAMSPMHQRMSMATVNNGGGKENLIDLNVKELRENFDRIPHHVKYQRKLIQELETMQFSLFLGLSNLELL